MSHDKPEGLAKLDALTFDVKPSSQKVYFTPSSFPVLQRSSMKIFTWIACKQNNIISSTDKSQ